MKLLITIHIFLYRLTGGRVGGGMGGFKLLLLTTTGRKSGKKRITPLGYFDYDGGYVITASAIAFLNRLPGWFVNLKSNPQVTVQTKDGVTMAVAEEAQGDLRNQLWKQLIEQAPGYADYAKRATQDIPMVILHPTSNQGK
jgi:deazaflavin-dependent oxidoreductase (nitroreductase family)